MNDTSAKHQLLIEIMVVVVLPLIIFGSIYLLTSEPDAEGAHADAAAEMGSVEVREALATVEKISPLKSDIFQSAEWKALEDFTPPIPEVNLGRENPFTRPAGVLAPIRVNQ